MLESICITFCESFGSQPFWRQAAVGRCGCYYFEASSRSTCFSLSRLISLQVKYMADLADCHNTVKRVCDVILWHIDHWSVTEKQTRASSRVSSSAYSGTSPTATMIPCSCCFCYTDLPHTPWFFPSHSLLQCPKRCPAPLLQPGKERSFFILCCFLVSLKPALCYLIHKSNHIHSLNNFSRVYFFPWKIWNELLTEMRFFS